MFCCICRPRFPSFNYTDEEFDKFIPDIRYAKVIRVYDGDTITIGTVLSGHPYRFSVRLRGIDTPEMKHKNEKHKQCGRIVRDILSKKIEGKVVMLSDISYDKYGRLLAEVVVANNGRIEQHTISDWLLREKLALPYGGGTKYEMTDEFLDNILSITNS